MHRAAPVTRPSGLRRRTAEAGFDHHLVKPPDPQAIENVLSELRRKD